MYDWPPSKLKLPWFSVTAERFENELFTPLSVTLAPKPMVAKLALEILRLATTFELPKNDQDRAVSPPPLICVTGPPTVNVPECTSSRLVLSKVMPESINELPVLPVFSNR